MDDQNWKTRTYLTGVIVGGLAGLAAAFVLVRRSEEIGEPVQLGAREGLSLGIGLLGLVRSLGKLSAESKD
ncbi:MAG: hypothetical protein PVH60_10970 [Anaerolineales bacterium]